MLGMTLLNSVSTLPYGLPDFEALTIEDYRDGIEQAMTETWERLNALATNPAPATEDNVLGEWERARAVLDYARLPFYVVKASDATDDVVQLASVLSPKLSAFQDRIYMDRRIYDRLTQLAQRAESGEVVLDAQASWLLSDLMATFERSGVALTDADQERLRAINDRHAELSIEFNQHTLKARGAAAVLVTDEAELDGLTEQERDALRDRDVWRIEQENTTQHSLLPKLHNRALRQRVYEASVNRALDDESDTRAIIVEMVRLRAEAAQLLGYRNHVEYVTERACAETPQAVESMLKGLVPAVQAQAEADRKVVEARFAELEPDATFAPWDWAYVAEIIRKERFELDIDELAPYLKIDTVLEAVFAAAKRLYGLTFERRPELRGHTADADVYEVFDFDGAGLGLFVMDFWARPTKMGGAWMNSIRKQSHLLGARPIVTNNVNVPRGTTTLTWDMVITLFHEFGHALHGLLSDCRYPSKSGTATPRDFVEFPSQVNEHWAWQPDAVIPAEWATRMKQASQFNQGFESYEMLAAMLLDQVWHTTPLDELPTSPEEVEVFEAAALASVGMDSPLIPPRYRSQYFSHIWGGYAGAYYSYIWAEMMDADAAAWFDANGGATRDNGEHFRRTLLAAGGSVNAMDTWRTFRGRDPEIEPLLKRKGLN